MHVFDKPSAKAYDVLTVVDVLHVHNAVFLHSSTNTPC